MDQAINTIRNRIDQLGVGEVVIQKHGGPGENEILVQLPGVNDPARVKNIMQSTAQLELKLVDSGPFSTQAAPHRITAASFRRIWKFCRPSNARRGVRRHVLRRSASRVNYRARPEGRLSFPRRKRPSGRELQPECRWAQRFGRVTEENIGKMLAIVLDGRIQSAPRINSRITDSGIITGGAAGFTPQAAQDLALVLRSGALPASIKYLDEEVVGPSLGADSIKAGLTAAVVALVSVVVFMLVYYGSPASTPRSPWS